MRRSKLNVERAVPPANEHQNPSALNRYVACFNQLQQLEKYLERLSWRSYLRLKDRQREFRGRRLC
jgi:hypothetical protein